MKRGFFHILFWLVYLVQDITLSFLWDSSILSQYSVRERLWVAICLCCSLLLPKIIFTYYIMNLIGGHTKGISRSIVIKGLVGFVLTVLVVRIIEADFVYPYLLSKYPYHRPLWSLFSFIFASIDLGFISGIALAIKQLFLRLNAAENEKRLIQEKLETELKFLKNQTNPHFLFNTLNSIYALSLKGSEDTSKMIIKLSHLLRYTLYTVESKFVPIDEEIKILEDYINLETIRYSNKLTISFKKNIDDKGEPIVPLLFLPLVENAFKHGVSEGRSNSYIRILATLEERVLVFSIRNSKETNEDSGEIVKSIGLNNVKRQLEIMYTDYDFNITNSETEFEVSLRINLGSYTGF
ncbi:sensor histidine kinase [Niabella beijingensis]|uniref:sensor histidine kinase n=1 Tax=Niabella beijingensis TaxID=2872700 RepID=UPI001CBB56C4|nr:sensor histidine kinase [Niabella beijingensis]MBZ4189416.1 sensor histidine kinase [Niabella beijingensis]